MRQGEVNGDGRDQPLKAGSGSGVRRGERVETKASIQKYSKYQQPGKIELSVPTFFLAKLSIYFIHAQAYHLILLPFSFLFWCSTCLMHSRFVGYAGVTSTASLQLRMITIGVNDMGMDAGMGLDNLAIWPAVGS